VSDVERLAEAMRQADTELDVDPVELSNSVDRARRRIAGRLLLVGTVSALAAMLLLTGGLAASSAVDRARRKPAEHEAATKKPQGAHSRRPAHAKGDKRGSSSESTSGSPHPRPRTETQVAPGSAITTGPPVEAEAEVEIGDLSRTEIVVINVGSATAENVIALVTPLDPEGEALETEQVIFGDLASGDREGETGFFKRELTCESIRVSIKVELENAATEPVTERDLAPCEPAAVDEEAGAGSAQR